MPFEYGGAFAFSQVSVRRNAPEASGVYGLSNAQEWLLVGEADNIKAALLAHLGETHSAVLDRVPTGFTFELCAPHNRLARQGRLIREFEPACNRHHA